MNNKMNFITRFAHHELISGSFFIFIGTTISSFLAFVLNLYLVRGLSYAEYGIFSALISVILLLSIPAQSLIAIIVKYAAGFFANNEIARAGAFYVKLFKYLFIFSVLIIIVFVILTPFIANFLHINDYGAIIIAGVTVAVGYLAILNTAFLQSMLFFGKLGFLSVLSGITKLLIGVLFVYLGFGVFGALFGNLMFPLIGLIFGFIILRKVISQRADKVNIPVKEFLMYAFPAALAIVSLSSFISMDVILVKHFFTPDEAGLYGGLSLIGRVIFYFTGPVALVMFPLVVKRHSKGENYNSLLYLSLFLVLAAGLSITIFYILFPEFTISIFLGGRAYLSLVPIIGLFGVFLTIYSMNNVLISYFLSIKKTFVALIVFVFALVQIILILLYHDTFAHIIYVSMVSSVLLMISLVLYYLFINNKKEYIKV
jgi:O-antigen/teichoic acid export membrane protein